MNAEASARRPRRAVFWLAVMLAVATLLTGGIIALVNYLDTSGADGAVRGYFAALQRGDASAALGFGDVPDGSRALLTGKVLSEQKRIAPIRDVTITSTQSEGNQATVAVHYVLNFVDGPQRVDDTVTLVKRNGSWRLDHVAVSTRFNLLGASDRATVVGAPLPSDDVLVFPGAAPIRLDTRAFAIDTSTSVIRMDAEPGSDTDITVTATDAGKQLVRDAVTAALADCLRGEPLADVRCPLPNSRAVPGTLRAVTPSNIAKAVQIVVSTDPVGVFSISGTLRFTGEYTVLDFDNIATLVRRPVTLSLAGSVTAQSPAVVTWQVAP